MTESESLRPDEESAGNAGGAAEELRRKAERSISKKYRKKLWAPFINAVKQYALISEGDRIAVCVSGSADSMLLATLVQMLRRYSDFPFEAVYLGADPGGEAGRRKTEENAALLGIPLEILPCGPGVTPREALLGRAAALGCGKIALGHNLNDVIETTVEAMFYGSRLEAMPPKEAAGGPDGAALIRPLYCVHAADIAAWGNYSALDFLPPLSFWVLAIPGGQTPTG